MVTIILADDCRANKPTDDCTFWYVNEYYTLEGQASSPAGWQTRIGSFRLPGCMPKD